MANFIGPSFTRSGSAIWHVANDGFGSGLDADLLDGLQGSAYAVQANSNTFTGTQTVSGYLNLTDTEVEEGSGSGTKFFRNIASLQVSNSSVTGALVIKTNMARGNRMMRARVICYVYSNLPVLDVTFAGYWYNSSYSWPNRGYTFNGRDPNGVRFAVDASDNVVIIIGDIADSWSYPKFHVTEAFMGQSNVTQAEMQGWTMAVETDLSPYTNLGSLPLMNYVGTITAPTAATVPLILKGAGSQTAALQEWQDSGGTVQHVVGRSTGPNNYFTGTLTMRQTATEDRALQFIPGTLGAGQEIKGWSSGGDVGLRLSAVWSGSGTANNNITVAPSSSGIIINLLDGTVQERWRIANTGAITHSVSQPTAIGVILKAAAGQSADLQRWTDSAGAVMAWVRYDGAMATNYMIGKSYVSGHPYIDLMNATAVQPVKVVSGTASGVPFAVQGAPSQTGDVQQWRNSSGTPMAMVKSDGKARFGGGSAVTASALLGVEGSAGAAMISTKSPNAEWAIWHGSETVPYFYIGGITATSYYFWRANWNSTTDPANTFKSASSTAGQVVVAAKGSPSQTGDLQQWQDSTAAILASISATGVASFAAGSTVGGQTVVVNNDPRLVPSFGRSFLVMGA